MSGGMFDGLRNAEKVLAQPKKEKKKPEPEEESMDDFDFSKLGGGTDWADADEQMPVMDEPVTFLGFHPTAGSPPILGITNAYFGHDQCLFWA